MKASFKSILGRAWPVTLAVAALAVIGALALNLAPGLLHRADAATQNYPTGVAVHAMPIQLAGTYTTTVTPVRFKLPYAGQLIGFSANARTISGGLTVDLQAAGVSLLSSAVSLVSNGVPVEGTVTTANVADEAELTVVLTLSNTPSHTDITVLPTFLQR